jgi:benzodiazapine receptor
VAADSSLFKVSNIVAFVLTVIINSIAGATTILGGVNTAEISDAYPTLVTPAGYTFAIWGVIYFLLGVFVVYQALPSQKGKDFQKKIGWLFVISSILNIAWIFCWQYQQLVVSVVLIFLLLMSLIALYLRLNIGRSTVQMRERLALHLPFSVYLGWITIATIADVAVTSVSVQWSGFGIAAETWALIIIVIALLITLVVIATRKDLGYSLVIIWALAGILAKQMAYPTIVMTLEASIAIIAIALAAMILFSRLWHRPKSPRVEENRAAGK